MKNAWPVLKTYDQDHLTRIGLPLGGIGTGTVSLGGRGQLFDFEIHNKPDKNQRVPGVYGGNALFTLYTKVKGQEPVMRVLEGALEPPFEGECGCQDAFHGLPRFRNCSFDTAYPFGRVHLKDPDVPVEARLEAFNPLIPADADRSGIPVAVLRYVLKNRTGKTVQATVCGTQRNMCSGETLSNKPFSGGPVQGLVFRGKGGSSLDRGAGSMTLSVINEKRVSTRPVWPHRPWRATVLHFWNDLREDGKLEKESGKGKPREYYGSLAASITLPPRSEKSVTFLMTWHFPNRYNWYPRTDDSGCGGPKTLHPDDRIGNYYSEHYKDAIDVAVRTAKALPSLEADTLSFVRAFCESDLPEPVKESALFNISTLRSQTVFRTPDGLLFGWEGCYDSNGCCEGSCTHVWNYETTTPFIFGDLARSMRTVEFKHATHPDSGQMSFRVQLPLSREQGTGIAAADGQMGCIMKAYREWKLSGDQAFLESLWPNVKKSLEFCWIQGGWDGDKDGVMEGCQHNTMDVEYYGPNPQMGAWYLGALRAAEEMARHLGEKDFAQTCAGLFQNGKAYLDKHLFNGEYYEHQIQAPRSKKDIAPGLSSYTGAKDLRNPELQLGAGCLIDQLVGQYMAHVCGLGYLLKPANIRKTLKAIMTYNFKKDMYGHFNNMRTYAINDESALLMASYPHGNRPHEPFPYFTEVMTGFEYTAATHMLYEGQKRNGLTCIEAIRNRYDGRRRNPYNEAECGHHYARAMAAWTGVLAITGFQYSGVEKLFTLTGGTGTHFWSTGDGWGTCKVGKASATVTVLGGAVVVKRFDFGKSGRCVLPRQRTLKKGSSLRLNVR